MYLQTFNINFSLWSCTSSQELWCWRRKEPWLSSMLFSMDCFLCLVFRWIPWNKNYCNLQMWKQVFRKVNLSNIVPACKCSLILDLKLLLLLKRVQRSMWKKMIMTSGKWILIMFASASKRWYLIANGSDSEFRRFIIQIFFNLLYT